MVAVSALCRLRRFQSVPAYGSQTEADGKPGLCCVIVVVRIYIEVACFSMRQVLFATVTTRRQPLYPELRRAPLMKFIWRNTATELRMTLNGSKRIHWRKFFRTTEVTQIEEKQYSSSLSSWSIQPTSSELWNVTMDADKGVVVDNYSLRGNSELSCKAFEYKRLPGSQSYSSLWFDYSSIWSECDER